MKILVVHNFYQQPGGEDQVFASECELLESHDHEVVRYTAHNDRIGEMGRLALVGATFWNRRAAADLRALVRAERPAVVHFHNTFPLISPAAYYAARAGGAAVVQTLHNFRLLCPNALLFRDGRPCDLCLGRPLAWPGVVHACYRGSRPATAVAAASIAVHRALGTRRHAVDRYIAPSESARRQFLRGGLPAEKVVVKPNFVAPDPGVGEGRGGYALFVGRLAAGKGIETLLAAWPRVAGPIPLRIIGDGELAPRVIQGSAGRADIQWLGRRSPAEVAEAMGGAAVLVFPSDCYETFGRVAIEAFARGTPVVASNHGAMAELVEHGRTGRLFRVGDPEDLARQVDHLLSDPTELLRMRRHAREAFEDRYTGTRNHQQLMEIYHQAIAGRRAG